MKELIKDMFSDQIESFKDRNNLTAMEKAALDEFNKQKESIALKESQNLEDKEFVELVRYYKKLEIEDDLLFSNYSSWSTIPKAIRNQIDIDLKPLYSSGVLVSCSKLIENVDKYFKMLNKAEYSICIFKLYTHYRLTAVDYKKRQFIKSRMNAKELKEFSDYVSNNIIYVFGSTAISY